MSKTPDLFEGIFDNRATDRREVWHDGRMGRFAAKNCTGDAGSVWPELRQPWGSYPDHPTNARTEA